MSEAQATEAASAEAAASGGGSRRGLIVAVVLVLAAGGLSAAWFGGLLSKHETAPVAKPQPPLYFDVDSNLIVNFEGGGRMRYLQLGVQLMTRDPATIDALKADDPVIRNNLILLFSEQTYEKLSSREGKEQLAAAALAEVRRIVHDDPQNPHVEALYFTTFVMQ